MLDEMCTEITQDKSHHVLSLWFASLHFLILVYWFGLHIFQLAGNIYVHYVRMWAVRNHFCDLLPIVTEILLHGHNEYGYTIMWGERIFKVYLLPFCSSLILQQLLGRMQAKNFLCFIKYSQYQKCYK